MDGQHLPVSRQPIRLYRLMARVLVLSTLTWGADAPAAFCGQNPASFSAVSPAAGGLGLKQVADLPGFVADADHTVSAVFSVVQIERPAVFFLLRQAGGPVPASFFRYSRRRLAHRPCGVPRP